MGKKVGVLVGGNQMMVGVGLGVPVAATGVGDGVETGDRPAHAVRRRRGISPHKKIVGFMS